MSGDPRAHRDENRPHPMGQHSAPGKMPPSFHELRIQTVSDLRRIAREHGVSSTEKIHRDEILRQIIERCFQEKGDECRGEGILEVTPDGHGFLRNATENFRPTREDIFVSASQIHRFEIPPGTHIQGPIRPPKNGEQHYALSHIDRLDGEDPESREDRIPFDRFTAIHPRERLLLQTTPEAIEARLVDLLTPIGKGQRGLIAGPPHSGKTDLLRKLGQAIEINHPEVSLLMLLIDERPESITDLSGSISGEVISSTFDEPPARHIQMATLAIQRARRLVESGRDVLVLLDSITSLARAYHYDLPPSAQVHEGAIDLASLRMPKSAFAAARNLEDGASLTILATIVSNSHRRLENEILEEFRGTENLLIQLDANTAAQRIYPAIDVSRSETRQEALLRHPDEIERIAALRRALGSSEQTETIDRLRSRLLRHRTNADFLMSEAFSF